MGGVRGKENTAKNIGEIHKKKPEKYIGEIHKENTPKTYLREIQKENTAEKYNALHLMLHSATLCYLSLESQTVSDSLKMSPQKMEGRMFVLRTGCSGCFGERLLELEVKIGQA